MAPIDPSELLAEATWLRRLARSLVHEGADDLVQDTWVAALRRPPDGGRSVRPWLRTVLTNVARLRWRGDAHRKAREDVAIALAEAEAPSSEQLLERHELQQLLARLVGELDEPFRSTILLRFAEGLAPTQIARRLGIPASTVRWRLKEALERLRVQLDALHRGDRRAWLAALAPLALPRAKPVAPVVPAVLAAGALAVVGWLALGTSSTVPTQVAPPTAARHIAAPSPTAPSDLSWLAQPGASPRALIGHVILDGSPAAGALVRLIADPLPPRDLIADANGRFDFGDVPPREYTLGATLAGKLAAIRHIDLRDPTSPPDVELVLGDCVAILYGKVIDASGTPIARAEVLREGVIGAEADTAGNYELCALPTAALVAEIRLVVRAAGFGALVVTNTPDGRVHHDFILAPEAIVSGRVLGPDGAPVSSARVSLALTAAEEAKPPERGISIVTSTDGDGRFRLAGLGAGDYQLGADTAHSVTSRVAVTLAAGDARELDLHVAPTGIVRGRVISHGRPVSGVTVSAGDEAAISQSDGTFVLDRVPPGDVEVGTAPYHRVSGPIHVVDGDRTIAEIIVEPLGVLRGTIRRHGVPVPFARVDIAGPSRAGLTTDAAGHYEARGLEPGKYGFYCDDRRLGAMFAEDHDLDLGPGETRDHDIELAWGGTIAGHVVDGSGAPVSGAEVRFVGRGFSRCATDLLGAFVCGGLAGDTYVASVHPGKAAHAFHLLNAPELHLVDGDARIDNVRLVVDPTLLAIAGTVVDGAGAAVPDVAVRALDIDRRSVGDFRAIPSTITDTDGHFRIDSLSAGDYHVEVESRGHATRKTVAAGATNVALVLDRSPCDGARGHELPLTFERPSTQIVWDHRIELVGWSLPATAHAGSSIELTLIYRVLQPLDRDWTIFAHFDSPALRVNGDHEPGIGWCPTSKWQPNETVVDRATIQFDHAGNYALTIGFFTGRAPDWINLPVSGQAHIADVHVE